MKFEKKVSFVIASILLHFLVVPFAYASNDIRTVVWLGFLLNLTATWLILKETNDKGVSTLWLAVGYITFDIAVRAVDGFSNGILFIPRSCFELFGIIYAYMLTRLKPFLKIFTGIILYALYMLYYGVLYPRLDYYINFGTTTGQVKEQLADRWKAYTVAHDTLTAATINRKKVVLIDFWNTSCGVYFQKFPMLEEAWKLYQKDSSISIYAINIPLERDSPGYAFRQVASKGYDFPVAVGTKEMIKDFKIQVYPTTLLIRNNQVVFRGRLEDALDAMPQPTK